MAEMPEGADSGQTYEGTGELSLDYTDSIDHTSDDVAAILQQAGVEPDQQAPADGSDEAIV